jgi:hypothetical protein
MFRVIDGTGGGSKIQYEMKLAELKGGWIADIPQVKIEPRFFALMGNVADAAGEKVVDGNYGMAFVNEGVTQVRAEEPCAAGDQNTHLEQ